MAWTDEMVESLKKMWKEGLTTGEIGKRLGVSKNSIVGKVHRLQLSARPSPIKKKEQIVAEPAKKIAAANKPLQTAKTSAPVKEERTPAPAAKPARPVQQTFFSEPKEFFTPCVKKDKPAFGKAGLTDLDNHTCRWPLGDPKDEAFHFCGKKVRLGQTYCEEHSAVAYVRSTKK